MEEILACRVCLVTDAKLFNMFEYYLENAYQLISGTELSPSDGLPHRICSYCCSLMLKCVAFQERCQRSQTLLNYAIMEQNLITTDYIRNIDRQTHNLTLPYKVVKEILPTIGNIDPKEECAEIEDIPIKAEKRTDTTDDEEPLSKIVKKPKKRKKKLKKEDSVAIDEDIDGNDFDVTDYDQGDFGSQLNDDALVKSKKLKKENTIRKEEVGEQNLDLNDFDTIDNFSQDTDYIANEEVEVIVLSKEEQLEEVLARKTSFNYLNSFYKCNMCYKGFMTEGTFNNHMARHSPEFGSFECEVCRVRWPCSRSLRAHQLTTHERQYRCRRCGHLAKSSHSAKEHSKWHKGFRYICDVCGATFSKSTSHLTHMRLHHPSGHACNICGESFIGEYGLNMHKKKAHRATQAESRCTVCGVNFQNDAALENHIASKGVCSGLSASCVVCGCNFDQEEDLKEHLKEHHKDEPVKCMECNRKFAHSRTFAIHYQRFHLGVKMKRRPGQGKVVESAVCEICGKKCMSKATLVYHIRTHTGERPYQCPECPKRFSICQRLQIHLRTHTGERPFKCIHCPKAFKHKAALNRHDRVHSGARPYVCTHCGKAFSQSNSMKSHVRTVHLKLPAPYRHSKKNKID